MKKPLLIFALKCSIIVYFAACTGIDHYLSAESATPHVTKGTWKINLFQNNNTTQTNEFGGYTLTFDPIGKIKVVKNGKITTGNWSEDEIANRITINLDTNDPVLTKLNDYWNVSSITQSGVSFNNHEGSSKGRLQITSL